MSDDELANEWRENRVTPEEYWDDVDVEAAYLAGLRKGREQCENIADEHECDPYLPPELCPCHRRISEAIRRLSTPPAKGAADATDAG